MTLPRDIFHWREIHALRDVQALNVELFPFLGSLAVVESDCLSICSDHDRQNTRRHLSSEVQSASRQLDPWYAAPRKFTECC